MKQGEFKNSVRISLTPCFSKVLVANQASPTALASFATCAGFRRFLNSPGPRNRRKEFCSTGGSERGIKVSPQPMPVHADARESVFLFDIIRGATLVPVFRVRGHWLARFLWEIQRSLCCESNA